MSSANRIETSFKCGGSRLIVFAMPPRCVFCPVIATEKSRSRAGLRGCDCRKNLPTSADKNQAIQAYSKLRVMVPLKTLFLLAAQYETAVIPLEKVCSDYFQITPDKFLRKCLAGEIDIPITRLGNGQKAARGVHVEDLAAYIDKQRASARKEVEQLRRVA